MTPLEMIEKVLDAAEAMRTDAHSKLTAVIYLNPQDYETVAKYPRPVALTTRWFAGVGGFGTTVERCAALKRGTVSLSRKGCLCDLCVEAARSCAEV